MKQNHRRLALLLAILTCLSVLASTLVSCKNGEFDETDSTETSAESTPGSETPDTENKPGAKTPYTITVKSAGGLLLEGVNIDVYMDNTLEDMVNYGTTDDKGAATVEIPKRDGYVVTLSGLPEGYQIAESYPLSGTETTITVTSAVIDSTDHTGVTYKLGDVIRDFRVTDTEGNELVLSELLKTKKMVLINFWYSECGPCVSEFPYLNSAYENYKDDVEVVAISHYQKDTEAVIKAFKEEHGLSFPMGRDYTGMAVPFNIMYYPTSIVIDRYGVICLIEEGALPSEAPFNAIFTHFTAENYQQKLIQNLDEIVEREKPNVEMPSSDEIKKVFASGIKDVTFSPETNPDDAEYSWPFIITEKNGEACIANSNAGKDSSYATMYVTVSLKKGEALAFDYWASCEIGSDVLYLLAKNNSVNKDTYKDIYRISGEDTKWNTCYTFVAEEDGEYSIGFCYIKDIADKVGDDRIYLKNLRVVNESAIDIPTYIPRYAAWDLKADGSGYNKYATVVYNEEDGLYHVNDKNGPLLLADLMNATRFSTTPVYTMALEGKISLNGKDYLQELVAYASYCSNSTISGLCSVNKELKELLEIVAQAVGIETDNPDQWLQICSYYDAYGTDEHLADPTKGLYTTDADNIAIIDPAKAFVAELGENSLTYDRMIMPRGLVAKFIPDKSGVYRIQSKGEILTEGWIFTADGHEYYLYEGGERLYTDPNNVSMVVYLEAGKDYYIDICYYDVYQMGTIMYDITYIGETYQQFTIASPGYFTFPEDAETGDNLGDLAEILAGGIDVVLHTDGYYYELREDGSRGSRLYADFIFTTSIFATESLESLIEKGAFNFSVSEYDEDILKFLEKNGNDAQKTKEYLKNYWGTEYEIQAEIYKLDEVLAGKMHGDGEDYSDAMRAYIDKKLTAEDGEELEGCVEVDKELAEILQKLMDKYTFPGVDHSWTKLCYYYRQLG